MSCPNLSFSIGFQVPILVDFLKFWDPMLTAFWVPWTRIGILFMRASRSLLLTIVGFESGRLVLQKQLCDVLRG